MYIQSSSKDLYEITVKGVLKILKYDTGLINKQGVSNNTTFSQLYIWTGCSFKCRWCCIYNSCIFLQKMEFKKTFLITYYTKMFSNQTFSILHWNYQWKHNYIWWLKFIHSTYCNKDVVKHRKRALDLQLNFCIWL